MSDDVRFRTLDPEQISLTIDRLSRRVSERFPNSGLAGVCLQLLAISEKAKAEAEWISTPVPPLRLAVSFLLTVIILGPMAIFWWLRKPMGALDAAAFVQLFESTVNDLIFIGLAILFLTSVETRIKRHRALKALHELRAIAHIIDMHQLTKDPEQALGRTRSTPASPKRTLSPADLSRYLDYCGEMLSLTGKIAALYVQDFDDGIVLASVNEIESLTTGLSNKIWQKIVLLHSVD